jgi:hypothetical protein
MPLFLLSSTLELGDDSKQRLAGIRAESDDERQ